MKHGFLILAHKHNSAVVCLIETILSDARTHVYLHLDSKCTDDLFLNHYITNRRVTILPRHNLHWGHTSILWQELQMLETFGKEGKCRVDIKNDNIKMKDLTLMLDKVFTNTKLFLKSSAMLYITIPDTFIFDFYKIFERNKIPIRRFLIWKKNKPTFSLGRLDYDYDFEGIIYTWLDKHTNYRKSKFRTTTWEIDAPKKCDLHPTMKPIELLEGVLLDGTKEGDIVIDYFGGSGTTLICAEQMNRRARLIELDPHYCDVIIQRWENLTGKKAELITDAD